MEAHALQVAPTVAAAVPAAHNEHVVPLRMEPAGHDDTHADEPAKL